MKTAKTRQEKIVVNYNYNYNYRNYQNVQRKKYFMHKTGQHLPKIL